MILPTGRRQLIWLLIFAPLILGACGGQLDQPEGPGDSAPEPTPPPICDEEDLVAPILAAPADQAINPANGQQVITEVYYPDANCVPDGLELEVYNNPGFGGNVNMIASPSPINLPPDPNGYYGSSQLTMPLDDCTPYFWHARAIVGGLEGPYSETRTFFTDFNGECDVALVTLCDSGALLAPLLVEPEDNEVNPNWGAAGGVLTVVRYPDENCFPDGFARFVDEDPSFPGPNNIFNPSPVNLPPDANGYYGGGQLTGLLDNCTKYYWRAQALVGNSAGPFSETWAFFTDDNGDCPTIFDIYIEIPAEMNFPDWPWGWPMQDTNCRTGDTLLHRNVGTLFPDQNYELLAVNPEQSYVKVHITSLSVDCWVWLDLIVIGQGIHPPNPIQILGQLPVEDPPPPPTATPTDTPPPPEDEPTEDLPECNDGIDNDGDGDIDMDDGRCLSPDDDSESS